VETADKMTEPQMEAWVCEYFKRQVRTPETSKKILFGLTVPLWCSLTAIFGLHSLKLAWCCLAGYSADYPWLYCSNFF